MVTLKPLMHINLVKDGTVCSADQNTADVWTKFSFNAYSEKPNLTLMTKKKNSHVYIQLSFIKERLKRIRSRRHPGKHAIAFQEKLERNLKMN